MRWLDEARGFGVAVVTAVFAQRHVLDDFGWQRRFTVWGWWR